MAAPASERLAHAKPCELVGARDFIARALLFAILVLPGSAIAAASDSTYSGTDLRPSTAAPWNPPSRVPSAESWESGLRLPLRIATYPLFLLGDAVEDGMVFVEDAALIPRALRVIAAERRVGLSVAPAALGEATGFGAEVGWSPPPLRHHIRGDVSFTTQKYDRERLVAATGPWRATYLSEWRPREPYFGNGVSSLESGETAYGVHTQSVRLGMSWRWHGGDVTHGASLQPPTILDSLQARESVRGTRVSGWAGPREVVVTTGRDPDTPSFELVHPAEAASSLFRTIEHFVYGAGIAHEARTGYPHWSQGWRASIDAERYDQSIKALAIGNASTGAQSFSRLTYRAEAGTSFGVDPRTLRLALEAIDQVPSTGGGFAISDLVSLGGSRLAGFEPGRFHDVDLLLAKLSYLFPLGKNLEFDLHSEAGGVYPDLGDARIRTLLTSFGVALRLRTEMTVFGMVGIDRSKEGMRFRFSFGGVE